MLINCRSLVRSDEDKEGGLFTSSGHTGFLVIAPFETTTPDQRRILVNRGWVSKSVKEQRAKSTRRSDKYSEERELIGVVRKSESRPQFAPKNVLNSDTWTHRDVVGLADKFSCEAVFLDAVEDDQQDMIKGGQTRVTLRNEHFSYMLTWFSLSAATFYMWAKKFILK